MPILYIKGYVCLLSSKDMSILHIKGCACLLSKEYFFYLKNMLWQLGLAWIFLFEELNLFIKESELCVALDTTLHTMVWNRSTPVPHFSTLPHNVEKYRFL